MIDKVKLILGAAIAAALVFFIMDIKHQDEIEIYIENYKQFQADAEAASLLADSLKMEVEKSEQEAEEALERAADLAQDVRDLQVETNNLRNRREEIRSTILEGDTITLEVAKELIPVQDSIIEQQEKVIDTQAQQIVELNTVIEKKDLSIYFLTTSVDSLQTVVANIPPPPKNPNKVLGFIPLPSRKVVLVSGFVAGILVANQIR